MIAAVTQAAAEATSDTTWGGPVLDGLAVLAVAGLALVSTIHWWGPPLWRLLLDELEAWVVRRDLRRARWVAGAVRADVADAADELGRGGR